MNETFKAGIISALCFLYAFIVSQILDKIAGPLDPSENKIKIFLKIIFQITIAGMLIYMAGTLFKNTLGRDVEIPVMVFIFFFFQKNLQNKINFIIDHK